MASDMDPHALLPFVNGRRIGTSSVSSNSRDWPLTTSLIKEQLVKRVVSLCDEYERPVATAAQARELLGLPQV